VIVGVDPAAVVGTPNDSHGASIIVHQE